MAQEHLAVANDPVLRRVPREAAATDPDRTARCSVVSAGPLGGSRRHCL